MKKVVNVLSVTGFMFFGAIQSTFAQETATEAQTFHQVLKQNVYRWWTWIYGNCISSINLRISYCH